MSESLVIRLGTNAQQPVEWLVWSGGEEEVIASGTLASAHALGELQERAGGRPAVVLVPGSDLIFRRVSLPGKYSRQSAPCPICWRSKSPPTWMSCTWWCWVIRVTRWT